MQPNQQAQFNTTTMDSDADFPAFDLQPVGLEEKRSWHRTDRGRAGDVASVEVRMGPAAGYQEAVLSGSSDVSSAAATPRMTNSTTSACNDGMHWSCATSGAVQRSVEEHTFQPT